MLNLVIILFSISFLLTSNFSDRSKSKTWISSITTLGKNTVQLQTINNELKSLEGYIVFYSNRDIEPKEELLYYYGDNYSKRLGINYKM